MKKTAILFLILFTFLFKADAQQDAQFSQYMFNGIYINPAYAGYKEQLNVSSFYRSQWTGITGAPKTMSLAIDAIANDGNVGLAFQVSKDELGAQTNLGAYANYAYRLRINNNNARLALGLGIGIVQTGLDYSKLTTNDPEPDQPVGMQSSLVPDARTGIYYADDRFYAGLSADNLISQYIKTSSYGFIPQPKMHLYLTAGMLIPLSDDILLKPAFLFKDDRAGPTSLDLSTFILLGGNVWIGGAYRTGIKLYNKPYLQSGLTSNNSAVAALQIFSINNLRIGYAYDISVGALTGYSGGTHEASITYFFKRKDTRMLTPRYF